MRTVRRGAPSKSGAGASFASPRPSTPSAAHAWRARVGPRSAPPCFFEPPTSVGGMRFRPRERRRPRLLDADEDGAGAELRDAVVARLHEPPPRLEPEPVQAIEDLLAIAVELRREDAAHVLDHDGARTTFGSEAERLGEEVALVVGAELLARDGERRTGHTAREQVDLAPVRLGRELMNVTFDDVPPGSVRAQRLASRMLELDERDVVEPRLLETERLSTRTGTYLYRLQSHSHTSIGLSVSHKSSLRTRPLDRLHDERACGHRVDAYARRARLTARRRRSPSMLAFIEAPAAQGFGRNAPPRCPKEARPALPGGLSLVPREGLPVPVRGQGRPRRQRSDGAGVRPYEG